MINIIGTTDALKSLTPTAMWTYHFNGTIEWHDTEQTQPTEAEITAEVLRLQTEYVSNEYQRQRAAAYPSIVDQLDTIYHSGIDAWKETITAVKEAHPK